jgi:hypothetical protein
MIKSTIKIESRNANAMNSNPSGLSRAAVSMVITVLVAPVLYLLSVAPLTRLTLKVRVAGSVSTPPVSPEWLRIYCVPYEFVMKFEPLQEPLGKYYRWWHTVRPNFITIYGQVNRQGRYEFSRKEKLTVSGAILRAGGFSQFASDKKVKVIRQVKGKNVDILVNLRDVMKYGKKHLDIPVLPGDVIVVAEKLILF